MKVTPTIAHLVIGLATIASATGMAVAHVVSGTEASTMIVGVAGILLGTSSVSMGAAYSPNADTAAVAAPPAAAPITPPVQ